MRRAVLALVLLLSTAPALAQQPVQRVECFEDARACTDPDDVPASCTVDLPDLERQTPDQIVLRGVRVAQGPFVGSSLAMAASALADDRRFAAARDRLCVVAGTPTPDGPGSPTTGGTSGLIGGNPGLIGGNPGLTGGLALTGGNPGSPAVPV